MREGTAEVPHQIADAHLPEAASVFDAATALDTAMDMVDPQPTLVEFLVRRVLLPRELRPQIEINSYVCRQDFHLQVQQLVSLRSLLWGHISTSVILQKHPEAPVSANT